jgi:metal-responsive CopG/Arc/MetJ family transcriptional regulator
MRKTAISVPEEVLAAVDRAARERGESRSGFITRVLREVVRARRDADITRRIDQLFATPEAAAEQRRLTRELDSIGSRWDDERW